MIMTRADNVDPYLSERYGELGRSLDARSPVGRRVDNNNHTGEQIAGIALDGTMQAVPRARAELRAAITTAGVGNDHLDAIELVAAELVTNSLRYSRSYLVPESIHVELARYDPWLILTVIDQGTALRPNPIPGLDHVSLTTVEPDGMPGLATGGRGLGIVAALCEACRHQEQVWPAQERRTWALWRLTQS